MPILPDYTRLQRQTPDPTTSVAQYQGGIAESSQIAEGRVLAAQGQEILQLAEKRRNQIDEMRVIEASTELRKKELALTFDEKEGYQNIKGGDVVKRPVLKEYTEKYKTAADQISSTLTQRQREIFSNHVASQSTNFQANVMRHAMAETEKYGGQVFEADLKSRYDTAAMSYKNTVLTAQQLAGVDAATHHRMDMLGVNDPAMRDQFVKSARGGLHTTVLEKAINEGDTGFATEYLKANKADMTRDQVDAVEKQLRPATDFAQGKVIALDAFTREQKDPEFNAAQYIMDQAGSNPRIADAAHSLYIQMVQEQKAAEAEQLGAIYKSFWGNGNPDRATMNQLINSPGFRKMSDAQQGQALHTMSVAVQSAEDRVQAKAIQAENRAYTRESREYTAESRERQRRIQAEQDKANSLAAVTKTNAVANSEGFANMKPEAIFALTDEIGIENVKYLAAKQAQTNKELRGFKVDPQVRDGAKDASILKNKERNNAFNELTDLEIAKEAQSKGRPLTLDEQREVVGRVRDMSVEKKTTLFGFDLWTSEKKMYELPPEQRSFFMGLRSQAEAHGRPPLSDEQLFKAWDIYQENKTAPRAATPPVPAPTPATPAKPRPAPVVPKVENLQAQGAAEATRRASEAGKAMSDTFKDISEQSARARKESETPTPAPAPAPVKPTSMKQPETDAGNPRAAPAADVKTTPIDAAIQQVETTRTMPEIRATTDNVLTPTRKVSSTIARPANFQPGKIPFPVEGARYERSSIHPKGLTARPYGQANVKTVGDGEVIFADDLRGFGKTVIVRHQKQNGNTIDTVYSGGDVEPLYAEGDKVKAGDTLFKADGEVYFDLRINGKAQNPSEWIKGAPKTPPPKVEKGDYQRDFTKNKKAKKI